MNTNNIKPTFSASDGVPYAELPVKPAFLRWARGDAKLYFALKEDPALYLGGWRATVKDHDGNPRPSLPLPIVRRKSADGRVTFEVYASPVIDFLPIQHRTRFELRERIPDPATGKEKVVIRAVSKSKAPGYTPVKQVFGLVFGRDDGDYHPAVIYLDKWSSFISFNRAEDGWMRITPPKGKALVRKYGTVGVVDKNGETVPVLKVYKDSIYTPIEAIGLLSPRFIDITDEITQLFYDSMDWRECQRWNASGETYEVLGETAKDKFLERCNEIGLTNVEIEQILKEAGGNYAKALEAVEEGFQADLRADTDDVTAIETPPRRGSA